MLLPPDCRPMDVINYRPSQPTRSAYAVAHRSTIAGAGYLFHRYAPLLTHPDPRRLDMRASILDPLHQFQVRAYQQFSQFDVYLLADLSASMGYQGEYAKQRVLARFFTALARSTREYGDRFAFVGCQQHIQQRWTLPLSRHRANVTVMQQQLEHACLAGNAQGLFAAWQYVAAQRSLVFLVSDFNFPLTQLHPLLCKLQNHDLVPVVLWDNNEYQNLPAWGLLNTQDMENGQQRLLWLRPGMREKLIAAYKQREAQLKKCFRDHGREALFLTQGFNAHTINSFLQQRTP